LHKEQVHNANYIHDILLLANMAARLDLAPQILHRRTDTIECWDDDPDFAELTQIQRPPAPAPSAPPPRAGTDFGRRESAVSSRRSTITSTYDLDALEVADREHQIPFDGSPAAAIKSAQSAGIPIPENVPLSALVGGIIKRLGPSKRAKKVTMHDDWGEDLELPTMGGDAFTVKMKEFPESLQHVPISRGFRSISPTRFNIAPVTNASVQLNKFRDTTEDELFFGECDEFPSLKAQPTAARQLPDLKSPLKSIFPSPPVSEFSFKPPTSIADDDFENDFEFPADAPLQLGLRGVERPRQPDVHSVDLGFEDWGDGDSGLGSSYAGTRAGAMERGPHSVISPSISAMTMESEDDLPFEGLILPDGMLPDLQRLLEKRRQAAAEEPAPPEPEPEFQAQKHPDDPANEEFFDGIEIGEGDVFDSKRLSLNLNVRQKEQPRKASPIRRTSMSLTFTTNKPPTHQPPPPGRLNRLSQAHPTLLPSAPLEPVVERENQRENQRETQWASQRGSQPNTLKRNPRNRWSGGSTTTEYRWSEMPPPPPIPQQRTERQTALNHKPARSLRGENAPPPTTTHAQLVKAKRSMPNIKDNNTGSPQRTVRPPSRASNGRPSSRASNSGRTPPNNGTPNSTRSISTGSSGINSGMSGGRPSSRTGSRPLSRQDSSGSRPKTPHPNANIGALRHPAPFIPGGSSVRNSHHAAAKASKQSIESRSATSERPNSRVQGRITPRHSPGSSSGASSNTTAKKTTPIVAPEHLRQEAAKIGTLTQPTRRRNFGDGTELETFDDLPTSAKLEDRFTVAPVARGAPKVRPKSMPVTSRETDSPKKKKPDTTPRQDDVPRFARDTTGGPPCHCFAEIVSNFLQHRERLEKLPSRGSA
jgi:hypothetical protein